MYNLLKLATEYKNDHQAKSFNHWKDITNISNFRFIAKLYLKISSDIIFLCKTKTGAELNASNGIIMK